MPRLRTVLALSVVYLAACRLMLAPLCNFAALGTASFGGDARLILWTLAWDNHALLDRVPGYFNANIFYPATNSLAYSEHVTGISLFTLPIYALTRNPVLAYNLVWILCYFLMALAVHALAWRYTRDHLASTVAGMIAAFSFYRMHQGYGHLHIVWAFWIPVSLLVMERWMTRQRWRTLGVLAAIVILQALASWYQAVIIAVADGVFFLWLVISDRAVRQKLPILVAQGLGGAVAVMGAIWPFARHYDVLTGSGPAEAASNSADLMSFLVPAENTFAGQWLIAHGSKAPRWIWGEQTVYLGTVTLALALAGAALTLGRRDQDARRLRFFILLAFVAVVLALGPGASDVATRAWGWTPFGALMRVPFVDLFRVPARFVELVIMAVAMLAAVTSAALHARWGTVGRAVTVGLLALILAEHFVVKLPGGAPTPFPIPPIYDVLSIQPPGPVVSLPDYADTDVWFQEPDYEYFSTLHWFPIANGYSRAVPPGFRSLMDRLKTFPSADCVAAMRESGIRYVVLHAAQYGAKADQMILEAKANGAFRMKTSANDGYLFEVVPLK